MNTVNLIGNLTKDPKLTPAGENKVCKFSLAVNEGYGDKQYTSFFDCTAWNKTAETISTYCRKGHKVAVNGSLRQERWTKGRDKFSKVVIKVSSVDFLFNPKKEDNIPFEVDDRAYSKKRGYGPDHKGTITKVNKRTVKIKFDSDGTEETINQSDVVIVTKE